MARRLGAEQTLKSSRTAPFYIWPSRALRSVIPRIRGGLKTMGAKSLRAGDFEEDQIAGAQQYRADFTVLARTLWGAVGYKIGIIPLPVFPLPFVAIATFIPSCLAFHHLMPEFVLQSVKDITQDSNFLDLFISGIIVGSIPGMGRAC